MKYRYKPTPRFWKSFHALPASQKESTRRAWAIFKENPFDPRLRPHKIQRLSSEYGCTMTQKLTQSTKENPWSACLRMIAFAVRKSVSSGLMRGDLLTTDFTDGTAG
jgi:hypothetical protein